MTSLTFSDSPNPLYIDENAFQVCKHLVELKIGRPIISANFPGWNKLSSITITSNNFAAPYSVFEKCDSLPNILFESSVTELNTNAFFGWNILKTFSVPESILNLKSGCFANCSELVSISFVDSWNPLTLESGAFSNCPKLKTITIGRPVYSTVFPGWDNIDKLVIISEKFKAHYANFNNCSHTTNVEFSPSVVNLVPNLFKFWRNIRSVTIPPTVKTVCGSCFYNTPFLESVTFSDTPNKISIEPNAFLSCDRLTTVIIGRPISTEDFPSWSYVEQIVITSNYFSAPFTVFSNCDTFPSIHFDRSVSSIRANAFKSWSDLSFLSNISSMQNIEQIGSSAFRGTNLNVVNLIHCLSLQSIGEYAFAEMENLEKVQLPPRTSIGVGCFSNCPLLSDVSLPPYLNEISESTFENCEKLNTIPLPPTIETIGRKSFSGTGISWIRVGNMVTVHPEAFSNCRSLNSVELFDFSVISKNAFKNSNNINSVVMYEFVTIDEDSFTCKPKFSYFGLTNFSSVLTIKALNQMGIKSIDVIENYIFDYYGGISTNHVKVNTHICPVNTECTSATYYDEYLRRAYAVKKSQIKMFALLHKQIQ